MASEKNPDIHFYSGFREKNTRGGVQFEILRNPGIDFYSGSRDPKKSRYKTFIVASEKKNPGIHFYSGFREKKHKGGVQFEILKNPGIDFHSGFRKTSQGGANLIPKKSGPPVSSNPDPH